MKSDNNQMQGTQQRHLQFVLAGRVAASMGVKSRLSGAPDLRPFGVS